MEDEHVLPRLTCLGNGLTDIVLKDQLVVYDNEKQRLGWKPYDCKCSFLSALDWYRAMVAFVECTSGHEKQ